MIILIRKSEIREIILWCIEKGYSYEEAASMVKNTYSKRKMKEFELLWKELHAVSDKPSSIYQSYSREQLNEKIKSSDNILNYGAMFTGLTAAIFVFIVALTKIISPPVDGSAMSPGTGFLSITTGIVCLIGALFSIYKPLVSSVLLFISTFLIILTGASAGYSGLMFIGIISALAAILSLVAWQK